MLRIRTALTWLVTLLLVMASGLPVLAGTASTDGDEAALPSLRMHRDGWLSAVPAAEQDAARHALETGLDRWSSHIPDRDPVDPYRQMGQTAAWTVLIYVAGDNNLEEAGLYDINEMEAVGSTEEVNILVQIDRSAEYSDLDGDWTGTRRYYIQQDDDTEAITSTVLDDLGAINSGDPQTVTDFATWGITTYPAEKYMLVLWDHGGAWLGNASDDETGDDLTLPEVSGILEQVQAETGIEQFEVVGFDMCLMAQFEVLQTIAPYARYGIASEENEPGPGWFYLFLEELVKDPAMDGAALTGHIVDYYMHFFDELWGYADLYGLSAFDFATINGVSDALEAFFDAVADNPQEALSPIADARNNTLAYGGNDDPTYFDIWSSVDVTQFALLLQELTASNGLQDAAGDVAGAIDEFVIHERHSPALEGSYGVSIYFPRTVKAYTKYGFDNRYPVEAPAAMAPWIEFLNVFHGTATATVRDRPKVDVISVYPDGPASIHNPAVVTLDVSGREILQVNYAVAQITGENERVVLDFDYLESRVSTGSGLDIINWSDGVTTRTFAWEAEVPVLRDGTVETYALMIPNRENPDTAVVNGQYIPATGEPFDAQLIFDLNSRESTQLWGFNETESGTVQPFELAIQPGDQFRPIWLSLDANNDLAGTDYGETLTLDPNQPLTFEKVPAPDGEYSISFVAENVNGDKTMDEALITVQNTGLDVTRRGYTDLIYGVTFQYPASWIRPRFTPDGQRLFTADLTTNTIMSVFPYTDVTSSQETVSAIQESWNQLDNLQVTDEREITINGLPAYVADYTYTYNSEPRLGAVVGIYVPDQGVGYGFDLDAPLTAPEPYQEALTILGESLTFFTPPNETSAWNPVTLADGQVTFPVPLDWVQEASGGWTLFGPADDARVFLGLTWAPESGMTNQALAEYWVQQLEQGVAGLRIQASEPYYIGSKEWHVVVFVYDDAGLTMAGAFFVRSEEGQDYTFWIEAPDADFDRLYEDVFSVSVAGISFAPAEP